MLTFWLDIGGFARGGSFPPQASYIRKSFVVLYMLLRSKAPFRHSLGGALSERRGHREARSAREARGDGHLFYTETQLFDVDDLASDLH